MSFTVTLRTRLVMLMVAAIVPLFGLSISKAVYNANAAVDRAMTELQFAASLAASSQQRLAETARQLLTAIANVPDIRDGGLARCDRYLSELKRLFPFYANLGIVGADGYARCDGLDSGMPVYLGDRAYFRDAVARRGFVTGEYIVGRLSGKPSVTFALPMLDGEGRIAIVVFASVDLAEMAKSVIEIKLPPGATLGIHDRNGTLLAGRPDLPIRLGQKAASPVLREAVRALSTGASEGLDGAGQRRLWAFMPSSPITGEAFFVAVSMDRSLVVGASQRQLWLELAALSLVAFLGGWMAWMIGGRAIVGPTQQILRATGQLTRGDLDVRIPVRAWGAGSEFTRIADGFNLMADSLQLREHELETELARSQQAYTTLELTTNSMHEGLIAVNTAGLSLLVNEPAKKLFSIDESTCVLTPQWLQQQGFFVPGTQTPFPFDELPLRRALKGESGGPTYIFMRNERVPQGRWLSCSYRPMHQGDDLVGALCVFADVTEQHESQESLRLLGTSISRLNDIVMITEAEPVDEPGPRIVFVNDAFERRTGYRREEVLGQSPRLLQGPKTQRAELDRIGTALKKWQPVQAELINYTKTGEEFWIELDIVPISDAKGGFTHWVAVARDITHRKLAEQALIDSEQRYAALFEAAPVPMWVYDVATQQFLTVNSAAVRGYGYSASEFLLMTLFDIYPEEEHARLREQLGEAAPGRERVWLHRRKDGSIFPVGIVSQPIQYAGRAARFVVALDMTAQIKAEKDVQEHLFTLQRAADAAQAITWHQTLDGMLQEVAEQARGVIGAHQAVVSLTVSSDWAQAINALSLSEKYAKYRDLIAPPDGSGIYALVCENNRAMRLTQAELEAHPRWRGFGSYAGKHPAMRGWLAVPLIGRTGKNIGLLQLSDKYEGEFTPQDEYVAMELAQLASIAIENAQLLEEISRLNIGLEQKVAERTLALVRQEALFRALAEQAPQVVWTAHPKGAVTYVNRAWLELVGGEVGDWMGSKWFAAIHPEDLPDVKARWQSAVKNQAQYAGIRRILAKDGSCHTMSYRASPVLDSQGEVAFWVGIDADITEVKDIEAALRLSNQELEAFSYSVSHDLRSPLNTIDGFSRLLAKQLTGHAGEKVPHYLSRIQAGVAQMGQLIEDLLSLAQVSRAQLRQEPVDLSVLARSLLGELQARQPERDVAVQIETGLLVHGDGRLIRLVMENLLSNAWKFTAQQAQAEIMLGRQFDAAGLPVFFVRDNGAGFDMAYADKLFNPFQRLHAASEFPGTGIGLATASRVIGRHGGKLWAEAAPGRGACFFFTLPRSVLSV